MATVRMNRGWFGEVSRSPAVRSEVTEIAERVAANVRDYGIRVEGVPGDIDLPVKVSEQTTDRARAQVQIAHPSGMAVEAKHGLLGKAALAEGLEVRD